MKKLLALTGAILLVFTLAACGNDYGDYAPGLHLGYTEGNEPDIAYVYVNADGYIEDVIFDSAYEINEDDEDYGHLQLNATKRAFDYGQDYIMSDNEYLWVEQIDMLAEDIVEHQGNPEYDIEDGKFEDPSDAVAGVTITVSGFIGALEDALDRASLGEDESPADYDVADASGDYTPGINFGYYHTEDDYDYAIVAVNEDGGLAHIKIDSGYESEGDSITKRALDYGEGYIMDEDGYLWVEQVNMLGEDIVDQQEVPDYDLDDPSDAIAGVTITINGYIEAVKDAIE